MKCLICGKDYVNLAMHLRKGHKIDPADYKEEFGMMKTTPLVDEELSILHRNNMNQRLLNPVFLQESIAHCKKNAVNHIGKPPGSLSQAGKNKIAEHNRILNTNKLIELAPTVAKILEEKKCILDVRREIGMSHARVMKLVNMGKATYSKDVALVVGTERRVASIANNKLKGN